MSLLIGDNLYRIYFICILNLNCREGSVAEWSKALVLGTSLSRRGFESHRYHTFSPSLTCFQTMAHRVSPTNVLYSLAI